MHAIIMHLILATIMALILTTTKFVIQNGINQPSRVNTF